MPVGKILPYHALKCLTQLHAELGGKIEGNRKSGDKLRAQMVQLEAVMKMLDPDFNARAISAKRRNTGNPWFKRGTLYRSVLDVLRGAEKPMTAREMMMAVLDGKEPTATRKQEIDLQAAILALMRSRSGKAVEAVPAAGTGPVGWKLTG